MVVDYSGFSRKGHFDYMPMPGGDKATEEPWRTGIAMLYQAFGRDLFSFDLPILQQVNHSRLQKVITAIEKGINCPLSSGAGRLFDAVAAICGICLHAISC